MDEVVPGLAPEVAAPPSKSTSASMLEALLARSGPPAAAGAPTARAVAPQQPSARPVPAQRPAARQGAPSVPFAHPQQARPGQPVSLGHLRTGLSPQDRPAQAPPSAARPAAGPEPARGTAPNGHGGAPSAPPRPAAQAGQPGGGAPAPGRTAPGQPGLPGAGAGRRPAALPNPRTGAPGPAPADAVPGLAPPAAPPASVTGAGMPAHHPVPGIEPDQHGADVGLTPTQPGSGPGVEVRQSEATGEDYTRGSTEDQLREDDFSLSEALLKMLEMRGSDLHLSTGAPPTVRVDGSLRPVPDAGPLTPAVIQRVMYAIATQAQREKFEETLELDFSYALPNVARFRVNMYRQRDSVGAAFRVIPYEIKSLEQLGMPPVMANFAALPRGFVLVTGPTGSGKSTTLAALVDLANRSRAEHIMTVEDPIEFLHKHKKCLVNQREVGEDTMSFANALKHVLRQDPDIILVGEMRDLETIQVALTAAETGHLVYATLHTQDAAQTIDRMIDVFPPSQQQQIRQQLAGTLQAIVCQTLCKTVDGRGRVAATEILVATPAIRNLIREGKTHQIYSALQAGASHGMNTMDQHLAELVRTGRISMAVGYEKCHHVEDFQRMAGRA